jgi:hypothetical protein
LQRFEDTFQTKTSFGRKEKGDLPKLQDGESRQEALKNIDINCRRIFERD